MVRSEPTSEFTSCRRVTASDLWRRWQRHARRLPCR
ncbi:hypothetical protein BMF94_7110 [Rhodotorula taiwanensis]|uniref:Uncharacterized protein n=1 Tax=Rhodotorula taiwanensis TaxID=741276 RepID=A0A2S5AZR5_9BASI|nr:hypothetical protein BMF94_7110 [Rhodotorula taiwanensis]